MSSLLSRNRSKMFPTDQTFFTPSYQEEFGYKTAQRVQCIRTGSSTGRRRNNPHPPHVRTDGGHTMGCTLCCVPQFKQLCRVFAVSILSSFRPSWCGGIPQHSVSLITPLMIRQLPFLPSIWLAPTLTSPPHTKWTSRGQVSSAPCRTHLDHDHYNPCSQLAMLSPPPPPPHTHTLQPPGYKPSLAILAAAMRARKQLNC